MVEQYPCHGKQRFTMKLVFFKVDVLQNINCEYIFNNDNDANSICVILTSEALKRSNGWYTDKHVLRVGKLLGILLFFLKLYWDIYYS